MHYTRDGNSTRHESFTLQDHLFCIIRITIRMALETSNGISGAKMNAHVTSSPKLSVTSGPHEENQYLDLIRRILADGEHRPDRYNSSMQIEGAANESLQNRYRYFVNLRSPGAPLLPVSSFRKPFRTSSANPSSPHDEARIPPRRDCRATLVHRWLDIIITAFRSGR